VFSNTYATGESSVDSDAFVTVKASYNQIAIASLKRLNGIEKIISISKT